MASKQAPPRRNEVIRCENCGEDYSVTYKRCPFCDERPGRGSRPVPSGRRVANGGRRGGVNPLQMAGLVISLILIIAAMVIVFRAVEPLLRPRQPGSASSGGSTSTSSNTGSSTPSGSQTKPDSSSGVSKKFPIQVPALPDFPGNGTTPGGTTSPSGGQIGPGSVVQVTGANGGLNIRSGPGTNYSPVASVNNGNKLTVVEDAGNNFYKVTFSTGGGKQQTGYVSKDFVVYSSGPTGSGTGTASPDNKPSGTTTPDNTTTTPPTTSSSYRQGAQLTVINAGNGLNVRSGPGTTYSAIATVLNGNTLTFQSDAGSGWIQITFRASGGAITTGYVRSDYVSAAG